MGLYEENEEIIEKLGCFIDSMCKAEIEKKIMMKEIEENSLDIKRYDVINKKIRFYRRIYAVNQNSIEGAEILRNRIACINNNFVLPCGISHMDMQINNQNYLVQRFYQDLNNKYRDQLKEFITRSLIATSNGRFLNVNYLDSEEQKQAMILDNYIKICWELVLWSSIFVTLQPNFFYRVMQPHSVPQKAFCNYYKNADVHGCNAHTQILLSQYKVPAQCDSSVDISSRFLKY